MQSNDVKELAQRYADEYRADCEAGYPFGRSEEPDEELEEVSVYDWLGDVLDIEYRVGSYREYRSARIMTACGGPNVWIDTARQEIQVAWYSPIETAELPEEFCDRLDEALAELWEMN